MALPTGFPPASFRLEDGRLICSSHGSKFKLVSAAGFAPAVTRAQAGHVAATPRAVAPAKGWRRGLGSCGDGDRVPWNTYSMGDWRTRRELHPQPSRRQRGALLIELRVRNGGKRW